MDNFEVQSRAIEMARENMSDLEAEIIKINYKASLDLDNPDKVLIPMENWDRIYEIMQSRGLVWPIG